MKTKPVFTIILLLIVHITFGQAQAPKVIWERTLTFTNNLNLIRTKNGFFIEDTYRFRKYLQYFDVNTSNRWQKDLGPLQGAPEILDTLIVNGKKCSTRRSGNIISLPNDKLKVNGNPILIINTKGQIESSVSICGDSIKSQQNLPTLNNANISNILLFGKTQEYEPPFTTTITRSKKIQLEDGTYLIYSRPETGAVDSIARYTKNDNLLWKGAYQKTLSTYDIKYWEAFLLPNNQIFIGGNGEWFRVLESDNSPREVTIVDGLTKPAGVFYSKEGLTRTKFYLCNNKTASLQIEKREGYKYQWNRNGTPISGATNNVYQLTSDGKYDVTVKTPSETYVSNDVDVPYHPSVEMFSVVQQNNNTKCLYSLSLNQNLDDGNTMSWYNEKSIIGNKPTISVTTAGSYSATIQDLYCNSKFTTPPVKLNAIPSSTSPKVIADGSLNVIYPSTVKLTADVPNNITAVNWYKNSSAEKLATSLKYEAKETGSFYFEIPDLVVNEDGKCLAQSNNLVNVVINTITSVIEPNKTVATDLIVWPNPSENISKVVIPANFSSSFSFLLLNSQGQILTEKKVTVDEQRQFAIDFSDFPSGLYFIKIVSDQSTITKKVIK